MEPIADLHHFIEELRASKVTGLSSDSRLVKEGDLFLVKKGEAFDGASFITKAIDSKAKALLTDRYHPGVFIPQYVSQEMLGKEGELAAAFFAHPSEALSLVGITGTAGKTTTAFLTHHILQAAGYLCGLMGSIEVRTGARTFHSELNTPDVIATHRYLREMVDQGCSFAVMEVSSHGLEQERVAGVKFKVGVFTNFTSEHLDYHKTLEAYRRAKGKLFQRLSETSIALFNADESFCYPTKAEKWTYGIENDADIRASAITITPEKSDFIVSFRGEKERCHLPLVGRFNIYNALAAIGSALALGISLESSCKALAHFSYVPGRLQKVKNTRGIQIIVDHAHKEGALRSVLETLSKLKKGRIITVFGCGGNRDSLKRKPMGEIASLFSDEIIVTNDNPRKEDPQKIVAQILEGITGNVQVEIEYDRKQAIAKAIRKAKKGDLVLIAGKGHEKTQLFADHSIPFDDVKIAEDICSALEAEESK